MTNLGSDNTPVKGQNFELPAGAQLDEDNGDLVIRDSGGSIVFRRDETNGEWVLDTVSADSLNTDNQTTTESTTRPLETDTLTDNPVDYPIDNEEKIRHVVNSIEVGTSATPIANVRGSAYIIIIGNDVLDGVGGSRFIDRVTAFGFQNQSSTELGSTGALDGRTYSVNGNEIELAMASGTYNVQVRNFHYGASQ